jgi:lipoate-protein ligase A
MKPERMSNITRLTACITAKEFIDITKEKIDDCIVKLHSLEQDLYTMQETIEESMLQLNNAIFEDCV